jgi:hypothetical protein
MKSSISRRGIRLLLVAIIAVSTRHPSGSAPFGFASAFSSWNEIPASGPSTARVTGHAGVPDQSSDAALFFGGHDGDSSQSTNDLWIFSFHGKSWEKLAPTSPNRPPARHDHCGTTCTSDSNSRPRALFFGGASNSGSLLNDVWALSLGSNNSWYQFSPLSLARPSPRTHSACACIDASSLIVFGGRDIFGASNDLWLMNLHNRTWSLLQASLGPIPGPLFGSCIYALSSSTVFIFGGFNSKNVASNDAWVLNVNVSQPSILWQSLDADPNPPARGFHGCVGVPASSVQRTSDNVYIRGGIGSGETRNDNMLQDIWSCSLILKVEASKLKCRPVVFASTLPLCSQCISVMIANIVLVHGGLGVGAKVSSETNLLFLSDMRIESVLHPGRPVPPARSGAILIHFTHLNAAKYLFLHGGADSQNMILSDTWLFDVSSSRYWNYCC